MKTNARWVWTPSWLNYGLFGIGLLIVWYATHSPLAMLGAFIASIHVTITKRRR